MPEPRSKSVCNVFYGYPVEEIMRVCVVSRATARHFKRGSRAPSPQAKRLWWLHLHGRVMGPEWRRFRFHGDALVDDAGTHYYENEIATIPLLHQKIAALEVEIDRMRYSQDVGGIGFFELESSLQRLLSEGQALLKTVKKVPKRRISAERENPASATATVTQFRARAEGASSASE